MKKLKNKQLNVESYLIFSKKPKNKRHLSVMLNFPFFFSTFMFNSRIYDIWVWELLCFGCYETFMFCASILSDVWSLLGLVYEV